MSVDPDARDAQDIEAREKLSAWLALPVVDARFKALEKQCFDDFRAADTDEKRTKAWMRAQAFQDLLAEIKGTQNAGHIASVRQDTRREQEARRGRAPRAQH